MIAIIIRGLLISAAGGRFPRGARQSSSSLRSCGVSACTLRHAGVAALRSNQRALYMTGSELNMIIEVIK